MSCAAGSGPCPAQAAAHLTPAGWHRQGNRTHSRSVIRNGNAPPNDYTLHTLCVPGSFGEALARSIMAVTSSVSDAAFGGLMLLGGKVGDLFERRRMFRACIAVFTIALLLGGLAPNEGLLLGARILQRIGAAPPPRPARRL